MRVALILAQDQLSDGTGLRAMVRVGGASLARHQLDLALGAGCERIVCFSSGLNPEIVELQHVAENSGARFHLLANARSLVGLVTAVDEVLVMEDGLFLSTDHLVDPFGGGPAVYVQPVEQGIAAGFERLDINHASAGLLRLTGGHVARLVDLPEDCAVFSALQRIALQAGVPQRLAQVEGWDGSFWTLLRAEHDAERLEQRWVSSRLGQDEGWSPTGWVTGALARSFGPALLRTTPGTLSLGIGAALLLVLALGASWLGYGAAGMFLAGLAWITGSAGSKIALIAPLGRNVPWLNRSFSALFDAALVVMSIWAPPVIAGQSWANRFLSALILILVLRLASATAPSRWAGWLADRTVLCGLLGLGLAMEAGDLVAAVTTAAAALIGLLFSQRKSQLTLI